MRLWCGSRRAGARAEHLRDRPEVPVHRGEGRVPDEARGVTGARVQGEGLPRAVLAEAWARAPPCHLDGAETVGRLERPDGRTVERSGRSCGRDVLALGRSDVRAFGRLGGRQAGAACAVAETLLQEGP